MTSNQGFAEGIAKDDEDAPVPWGKSMPAQVILQVRNLERQR